MTARFRIACLALAACLAAPDGVWGQAGAPGERLAELREIYQRERKALRVSALRRHLAALEAARQAHIDTDDAAAAKTIAAVIAERRRELEALGERVAEQAPPAPKAKSFRLTPGMAEIRGLKRSRNALYGWTGPGTTARWLGHVPPGRYDIFIDYYPVSGGGGVLEVQELQQLANVTIPPAGRDGRSSRTVKAATFTLRGPVSLRLTPKSRGRDILWLNAVRVVPVADAAATP